VLEDTNDSKRAPPMSNAPSPKRRPRSGKDPGSTTSPSPLTRSVKASHAWTKHPVHAGARRSAWDRMPSPFKRTPHREAYPSSEELVVEERVRAVREQPVFEGLVDPGRRG